MSVDSYLDEVRSLAHYACGVEVRSEARKFEERFLPFHLHYLHSSITISHIPHHHLNHLIAIPLASTPYLFPCHHSSHPLTIKSTHLFIHFLHLLTLYIETEEGNITAREKPTTVDPEETFMFH